MNAIDLRALLADPVQSGAYFIDDRDTAAMAQAGTALDFGLARIDLSWWPAPGYLLLVEQVGGLREADDDTFATLLSILNEAAEDWRERNVAFWALLPLPADALAALET